MQKEKEDCVEMFSRMVAAVRSWQEPIDVIVVLIGYFARFLHFNPPYSSYNKFDDPPMGGDVHNDRVFQFMSAFYANLSAEARELTIVGSMNVHFDFLPSGNLQKRLKAGKPIERMFNSRKVLHAPLEPLFHSFFFSTNWSTCPKCGDESTLSSARSA